jgi:exodeoxyribonuclease VII large subunit
LGFATFPRRIGDHQPMSLVTSNRPAGPRVLTPSQLNRLARDLLEDSFAELWLEGEISGFTRAASGHWYFQLKDSKAQLRSVMFRAANLRVARAPLNGDRVLARGRISLFEARGDFQFLIEHLQGAGLGQILLAFEALKARLGAEGLFDGARKRPLPALPVRLDLISSPKGAAVHDVLSILRRRWPALQVRIYESAVQGPEAPRELCRALAAAAQAQPLADVCLITRGGGAREDLAAFDDEALARAIVAHPVPVVAAVGHETDYSIADLAADLRAATPSAAAELISPDRVALRARLEQARKRVTRSASAVLERSGQGLDRSQLRLRARSPVQWLSWSAQRLQQCERRAHARMAEDLRRRGERLDALRRRLSLRAPEQRLAQWRSQSDRLGRRLNALAPTARWQRQGVELLRLRQRLQRQLDGRLLQPAERLARLRGMLASLGPDAVLARGYALVFDAASGRLLQQAVELQPDQSLRLRLRDGERGVRVED